MKQLTILLLTVAALAFVSQVASSDRFLAEVNATASVAPAVNGSAPNDTNHTNGPAPSNISANASSQPPRDAHRPDKKHRPEPRPQIRRPAPKAPNASNHTNNTQLPRPVPVGNNSALNNSGVAAATNASRLLPAANNSQAKQNGQRAGRNDNKRHQGGNNSGDSNNTQGARPAPSGGNANRNDSNAAPLADANATRLLPAENNSSANASGQRGQGRGNNNGNDRGDKKPVHAVRPRGSAPKMSDMDRSGVNGSNSSHASGVEHGEDGFDHVTRQLLEEMERSLQQEAQGKENQSNGRRSQGRAQGKGQKRGQGRSQSGNHTQAGEDHFGGLNWGHGNGEDLMPAFNSTSRA